MTVTQEGMPEEVDINLKALSRLGRRNFVRYARKLKREEKASRFTEKALRNISLFLSGLGLALVTIAVVILDFSVSSAKNEAFSDGAPREKLAAFGLLALMSLASVFVIWLWIKVKDNGLPRLNREIGLRYASDRIVYEVIDSSVVLARWTRFGRSAGRRLRGAGLAKNLSDVLGGDAIYAVYKGCDFEYGELNAYKSEGALTRSVIHMWIEIPPDSLKESLAQISRDSRIDAVIDTYAYNGSELWLELDLPHSGGVFLYEDDDYQEASDARAVYKEVRARWYKVLHIINLLEQKEKVASPHLFVRDVPLSISSLAGLQGSSLRRRLRAFQIYEDVFLPWISFLFIFGLISFAIIELSPSARSIPFIGMILRVLVVLSVPTFFVAGFSEYVLSYLRGREEPRLYSHVSEHFSLREWKRIGWFGRRKLRASGLLQKPGAIRDATAIRFRYRNRDFEYCEIRLEESGKGPVIHQFVHLWVPSGVSVKEAKADIEKRLESAGAASLRAQIDALLYNEGHIWLELCTNVVRPFLLKRPYGRRPFLLRYGGTRFSSAKIAWEPLTNYVKFFIGDEGE